MPRQEALLLVLRVERSKFGSPPAVDFDLIADDPDAALRNQPKRQRVEAMLHREDTRRQMLLIVAGMNGDDRLADDWATIEFGTNEVHSAARETHTRRERPPLGVQAAERGKKRGMNIDHPIVPSLDKTRRQHAHKPGEADERDPLLVQQLVGFRRKSVLLAMRNYRGGNPGRLRQPEPRRRGAAADNQRDLRRVSRVTASLDQRLQVRSPAGNQDTNSQPCHLRAPAVKHVLV